MDQQFLDFLNNLIQQAMANNFMQSPTNFFDPLAAIPRGLPTPDGRNQIGRGMQFDPILGLGNTITRSVPNNSNMVAFLPGMYGTVQTGGLTQPDVPPPQDPREAFNRTLGARTPEQMYKSNVGGIFPATLVDYYQPSMNANSSPYRGMPTRGIY